MQVSLGIFVMLSATTENSVGSITIQQTFAVVGYTLFMMSKLLTSNSLVHEVALYIYFALICLSGVSWYYFNPLHKDLPDYICTLNGRYYLGDRKGKSVVVTGNFKYITLRFSDRLKGPLMKLVSKIKLYAATE